MSAESQIYRLADYLMRRWPEEITGGGACDVAIRILKKFEYAEPAEAPIDADTTINQPMR